MLCVKNVRHFGPSIWCFYKSNGVGYQKFTILKINASLGHQNALNTTFTYFCQKNTISVAILV